MSHLEPLIADFALVAIMDNYYLSALEKQSDELTQKFTDNLSAREKMNEQKT